MATDTGYERGNYLRVCDVCGHRFHFKDLSPIGELKFACPDDAPGLTALQISRFNAKARPLVVKPNKYAKDYVQVPTYQMSEGELFNHVIRTAPAELVDGEDSPEAAAWTALYMAKVLLEERRPTIWECDAKCTLAYCAAYLLSLQYGSSTGPSGTADNPRYGGIYLDTTWDTTVTLVAGIAFVYAYRATAVPGYLTAAERIATFVRHVQSGDSQTTAYTVYPSGGGSYHIGGLSRNVDDATGLLSTSYDVSDVLGCWFLSLMVTEKGGSTQYGDAAATSFHSRANRASLSTMLSELTAFGESGAKDSASSGALVTGLSTTAPRETYVAATNGGAGTATWTSQANVASRPLGMAIRGLYEAGGNTAKVAAIMAWLAAFTTNSTNATPASMHPETVLQGITGTYDPAVCPADNLKAAAPFTESTGARYDWGTFGLLAPVLAATGVDLRASKDALSKVRRFSTKDIAERYLGPIGVSGLSFQPWAATTPLSGQRSVTAASMVSLAYREQPGRFPMRPPIVEVCPCTGDPGNVTLEVSGGSVPPDSDDMLLWLESDVETGTPGPGFIWGDQSGNDRDASVPSGLAGVVSPTIDLGKLDGMPGIRFSGNASDLGPGGDIALLSYGPAGVGNEDPLVASDLARTVFIVAMPASARGGELFVWSGRDPGAASPPTYICDMRTIAATQYGYTDFNFVFGPVDGAFGATIDYSNTAHVFMYYNDTPNPASEVYCRVDNVDRPIAPNTVTPQGVTVNGYQVGGMAVLSGVTGAFRSFDGWIFEVLAYTGNRSTDTVFMATMNLYLHTRYPSLPIWA